MPTRIDGNLFEAAKVAGELHSRSAAQQIDHWARVGRELESSPTVTVNTINRVLSGDSPYDNQSEQVQAIIRAEWDAQIAAKIGELNFETELLDSGRSWSEADDKGMAVSRGMNIVGE